MLLRPDGSPMYITFSKASGRRSNVINVTAGKARLTLSIDGVDFTTQWERAVQFLIDELPISDVEAQQQVRASRDKFLEKYGIVLKRIEMWVIDTKL